MIRPTFAVLALAAAVACSSGGGTNDGGTDSGNDVSNPNSVTQTGQIVDFTTKQGLEGIIVSSGSSQATSDNKGNYALTVTKGQAYTMTISSAADAGTGYLTLDEQEWTLSGNADRGSTSAVSNGTESLLKSILQPQPTPALAVLSILVESATPDAGACTSATGATISAPGLATDGGTGAHLVYFVSGFPSASATSVTDGQLPSAIIYDLPAGGMLSNLTVTPPAGCTVQAFPFADPGIPTLTYTGAVKLEASQPAAGVNVASFMRIFLK